MKKFLLFVAVAFVMLNSKAQTESDSVMYNNGLLMLEKSVTAENYIETAFYFDSLSKEYPGQWLLPYYTGLSYVLASKKALDSKTKDELLDKAQPYVNKAFVLKPGEAELHILQAFLYQTRLMVDPQARAISYAQKADASLKKALEADPSNPRAYFLQGSNIYYTPAVFKGGPKNALPVFLKAREKYNQHEAALSFMPDWGKGENEQMIRACNNEKKPGN